MPSAFTHVPPVHRLSRLRQRQVEPRQGVAELVLGAQVNKHAPGRGSVVARQKLNVDGTFVEVVVVLLVGSVRVVLFLVELVSVGRGPSVRQGRFSRFAPEERFPYSEYSST